MAAATTRAMPMRGWERPSAIRQSTRTADEVLAEQLAHEVRGVVRDGVAPRGDVLIGAHKIQLVVAGRLRRGNIDDVDRDAIAAHRVSQWRNRYIRIVA